MTMIFTGDGGLFSIALKGYLFQILMVLLCYSTTVFAITLTGTPMMSIIGTMFFFLYIPFVYLLAAGFKNTYYNTYMDSQVLMSSVLRFSSPFLLALSSGTDFLKKVDLRYDIAIVIAMTSLFLMLSLIAFKFRRSETAGKAISFPWLKTPLKILVVIPSGLFASLIMSSLIHNLYWTIFGILCGVLISHCVIEIIYHADFKGLFANPLHLMLCVVLSLSIVLIHNYDLFGYDTYRPKTEKISSVSLYSYTLEPNGIDYNSSIQESYSGKVEEIKNDIMNKMYITDPQIIDTILDDAISYEKIMGSFANGKSSDETDSYYDSHSYTDLNSFRMQLDFRYRLKNGKIINRKYSVDYEKLLPTLKKLYSSKEYKDAIYPILHNTIDDFVMFNFRAPSGYERYAYDEDYLASEDMPSEDMASKEVTAEETMQNKVYRIGDVYTFEKLEHAKEILTTFQEEWYAMDYEYTKNATPTAYIRFLTKEDVDYIREENNTLRYIEGNDDIINEQKAAQNSANPSMVYQITEKSNDIGYYPVYPSFQKTIKLLEQDGVLMSSSSNP